MPKRKDQEPTFKAVQSLLISKGVTKADLARVLDWSYEKAKSRFNNPAKLTLSELRYISAMFSIPFSELFQAVSR